MEELQIICRKPVTFTCRVVAGVVMVAAPMFDTLKDKPLSDVPTVTWIVILLAVAGAATNTAAAWFSSAAGKAREEMKADDRAEAKQQ